MIYGRFGQQVTVVRMAVLADVEPFDNRKPDRRDRAAVKAGSYVIVKDGDKQRLYHQCYLRADGGSLEITAAIIATKTSAAI